MCAALAACVQYTIIPEPYATETFSWRRVRTQHGVVKRETWNLGAMNATSAQAGRGSVMDAAPGCIVRATQGVFLFRRNHGVTVRRGLGGFFRASTDGCEMVAAKWPQQRKKKGNIGRSFSITPACHPGHSGLTRVFQPTGVAMGQCITLSSSYHATVHRPIMHPVISQSSLPLCLQMPLLPARLSPYPMAPDGDCYR